MRELLQRFAAGARHGPSDVRKIRGFVAAGGRLRTQIARQEIWAVGFEHESSRRNVAHQGQKMRAASLVVDPAGDADRETHVQTRGELCTSARETVRDSTVRQCAPMFAQYRDE